MPETEEKPKKYPEPIQETGTDTLMRSNNALSLVLAATRAHEYPEDEFKERFDLFTQLLIGNPTYKAEFYAGLVTPEDRSFVDNMIATFISTGKTGVTEQLKKAVKEQKDKER